MNAITQALWEYASNHERAYKQIEALADLAKAEGSTVEPAQALAVVMQQLVECDWLPEIANPASCTGFVRCAVLREVEYRAFAERWLA